jgi:hypothetical protein
MKSEKTKHMQKTVTPIISFKIKPVLRILAARLFFPSDLYFDVNLVIAEFIPKSKELMNKEGATIERE